MLYILTLTWNNLNSLSNLYSSLIPALGNINYQWLIKDNKSIDKTVEVASTWGDKIKVIDYKDNNQNFSEGNNLLFSEASPKDNDIIFLLNNDVIFNDKTSISKMMSFFDKDKNIGVVGAKLKFNKTNLLQHAGVIFDYEKYPHHFRSGKEVSSDSNKNRIFQCVTGACLMTKAEYYKNICKNTSGTNGMDEKYHWAFDDVDLCLSIGKNMKKTILYYGESNIFHEESQTLKTNQVNKKNLYSNCNHLRSKWKERIITDDHLYFNNKKYNLYK